MCAGRGNPIQAEFRRRRAARFPTIDGFTTRTPLASRVDLHAPYRVPVGGAVT
jgi:hypothetical protein